MCFASPGNPPFGFLGLLGSTNPSHSAQMLVKSDMICVQDSSCPPCALTVFIFVLLCKPHLFVGSPEMYQPSWKCTSPNNSAACCKMLDQASFVTRLTIFCFHTPHLLAALCCLLQPSLKTDRSHPCIVLFLRSCVCSYFFYVSSF